MGERWSGGDLRRRVVRAVRAIPGAERAVVALSPVHRRRRARVRAERDRLRSRRLHLPTPTWALHTIVAPAAPDGSAPPDGAAIGWALLDPTGDPGDITFQVGGEPATDVQVGVERPGAPAGAIGFSFAVPSAAMAAASWSRPLELSVGPSGLPIGRLSYRYPGASGPLPPPSHRVRVSGNEDVTAFLMEGCTAFHDIDAALAAHTGRSLRTAGAVVDWGVGCGRFARYLEPFAGERLQVTGLDVDAVNVEWCAANLPWMTAIHVAGTPPTPLPAASVDVLVGISVLTHLRAELEVPWLDEIRRVLRPGGIAMLTALGDANFARSGLGQDAYGQLQVEGILDAGRNGGIDGAVPTDEDYYRNTFHTERHVRAVWGSRLELIAHEPALIGNHQDLYIFRR